MILGSSVTISDLEWGRNHSPSEQESTLSRNHLFGTMRYTFLTANLSKRERTSWIRTAILMGSATDKALSPEKDGGQLRD